VAIDAEPSVPEVEEPPRGVKVILLRKGSNMKNFTLPAIGFLAAAIAVAAAGIATDALARGGAGGSGSVGSFSAGNAPSVSPLPISPIVL